MIMMTDIVGFTQLTREKESDVGMIGHRHRSVLQDRVSAFGGQIINIFGDSALAILEDPVSAVACALDIQKSFQKEPLIPLRIALHQGRILLEGGEVYGEAINLCARILKLAAASTVLLSDRMENEIREEGGLKIRSLGSFNLKYVERQVEIFGLVDPMLQLPKPRDPGSEKSIVPNSIAVLPLVYRGKESGNEYLGDGISEAIIHSLSKLRGLFITSRSSSYSFRGGDTDVKEIGRILGVAHLLEGSVQVDQNRIKITIQLIDTRTGFHVLSESFNKEMLDIFSLQEDISRLIAQRLKITMDQQEKWQLEQVGTTNARALDVYLQARYYMANPSLEGMRTAIDLYRRCIEEDPDFVLPYAGISISYLYLGALRHLEEEQAYEKANKYALRAIEMAPDLPEAIVTNALSTFWSSNWNLKNMEKVIATALRVIPGSSEIRLFHGMFILMTGRVEDALAEILLANKLDPLNPHILSRLAYTYLCLQDFEEAHSCFRLAHNTAPFSMYINYILAWSYLLQGRYAQAESALAEVDEKKDVYQSTQGTLGYLYARQGKLEKAYDQLRLIGRMQEEGSLKFPHYNFVLVYAGLHKRDEMFYHLEKAFKEKPVHLMFIQADPFWEVYRTDSRYIQLVSRVFKNTHVSRELLLQSETSESLKIQADQLLYIRAEDNYSRIVWIDSGSRHEKVMRSTLQHLEKQLSGSAFFRCHRSYLVNLDKYELSGDSRGYRLCSASDPLEIPVSRQRSKTLANRLKG